MIQASILEQIGIFFKILTTNPYIIILLLAAIILFILLMKASKSENKKITKILYSIIYIGTFGTLLYFFHTQIFELFDYLFNNIFLFLFFPNLAVYILVLVIINIIIIKSTLSEHDSKITKNLNIIFFVAFNIIFYLIIDNIIKNNVNVYEQLSIYTNNNLLVLVELSMKLFVVWALVLVIIKLSNDLISKFLLRKATNKNLILTEKNNSEELAHLNTIEVKEKDYETPKEENKFNDYIEVVPIKKRALKLTDDLVFSNNETTDNNKVSIEKPKVLDNMYSNLEFSDYKTLEPNKEIYSYDMPYNRNGYKGFQNTLVINENVEPAKNEIVEEAKKEVKEKPITLSSYDSIFKENTKEVELNINENMGIVFDNSNNYLHNIMLDIEELKNNKNDEDQVKKVYDNIMNNQKELTLSDYNYLINSLLEIKK